jgi:hypothetical protein
VDTGPQDKPDTPLVEERLAYDLKILKSFGYHRELSIRYCEMSKFSSGVCEGVANYWELEQRWVGRCTPGSGDIPALAAELSGWASLPDHHTPASVADPLRSSYKQYGVPFMEAAPAPK